MELTTTNGKNGGKKDPKKVDIVRTGEKIVIPEGMTLEKAAEWLRVQAKEEERTVAIHEVVGGYPLDGALALWKALSRKYGFTSLVPTPGFFGSENPPIMIGVETGVGETTQVPWGRMVIPGIEGFLEAEITIEDGRAVFLIGGEVKQKHKHLVAEIAKLTRTILAEESIYRGKAIRVRFSKPGQFDPGNGPKFMDTRDIREEELIFPEEIQRQVETSLFTPIEKTILCRQYKIPLKRGVLLEGPYGVGKTLTAYVVARKCEQSGWTFIYLDDVSNLQQAILFAKQYQPAVIFAEDIDRVVSGDRSVSMDSILNTIDGVDTKASEIIVILTTNHVDKINPAMLRPGRLDAVISIKAPDSVASVKLIQLYARGLIQDGEDLTAIGSMVAGQIPATIREVVERSKLAAVHRMTPEEDPWSLKLTAKDLEEAASGMMMHLKLMEPRALDLRTPVEKFAAVLGMHLEKALKDPSTHAVLELAPPNGQSKLPPATV